LDLPVGALLALLVGVAPAAPPGGAVDPVRLRFRPHPAAPIPYAMRETVIGVDLLAGGQTRTWTIRIDGEVRRRTVAAADGRLDVTVELVRGTRSSGDGAPEKMAAPAILERFTMSADGRRTGSAGEPPPPTPPASLVFPTAPPPPPLEVLGSRPVAADPEWSVDVPAGAGVPIPLSMRYRIAGRRTVAGRPCVVVELGGQAIAVPGPDGHAFDAYLTGRVAFDPIRGVEVESRRQIRLDRIFPAGDPQGLKRVHTERTIELVPPAAARSRRTTGPSR
jgi:hypothetical protein